MRGFAIDGLEFDDTVMRTPVVVDNPHYATDSLNLGASFYNQGYAVDTSSESESEIIVAPQEWIVEEEIVEYDESTDALSRTSSAYTQMDDQARQRYYDMLRSAESLQTSTGDDDSDYDEQSLRGANPYGGNRGRAVRSREVLVVREMLDSDSTV